MATKDEQETTVSWAVTEEQVRIWTATPKHLRSLRADSRATEIRSGEDWGEFEVPASAFDPLTGFKRQRKKLTEAQRLAAAERLKNAREAKANKEES